jgi:hypothetical protein
MFGVTFGHEPHTVQHARKLGRYSLVASVTSEPMYCKLDNFFPVSDRCTGFFL